MSRPAPHLWPASDGPRPAPHQRVPYDPEPDYRRPRLEIPAPAKGRFLARLAFLYGDEAARRCLPELERILRVHHAHKPPALVEQDLGCRPCERFTEQDVILITYGDLLRGDEPSPLATLADFCDGYLEGTINTIHILPFFPYSSDRGFAVTDFETVDPHLGTWRDIHELGRRYRLMFDGVINHVSSRSRWFREFRSGHPHYRGFFISFDSPDDLPPEHRRLIFRPRTSDILTPFDTIDGTKYVWTTFSPDQIDLNYKDPDVLMRVIEILLLYVRHGADIIRLDAVTYLWWEPGTRGIHLEQTHQIVKLFRDVLDLVAPHVALITETNVPHAENISYFGNGRDEAQMVYNFALPPLVLYTFYREDATALSGWARGLEQVSDTATYFNFLDSHDGIGLMGVRGVLPDEEIGFIVRRAREHGALVSYRAGKDGEEEPYELNTTWFSALNREDSGEDIAFQVRRFVATRVVALVLRGVPGIYLHSLIGTRNDVEAVLATGSKRAINRTVIDAHAIRRALDDPLSKISRISRELGRLIAIRTRQPAFHPNAGQHVLTLSPRVFAVLRVAPGGVQRLLALVNVSREVCHLEVPAGLLGTDAPLWYDLVSGMEWLVDGGALSLSLAPYEVCWLTPEAGVTP